MERQPEPFTGLNEVKIPWPGIVWKGHNGLNVQLNKNQAHKVNEKLIFFGQKKRTKTGTDFFGSSPKIPEKIWSSVPEFPGLSMGMGFQCEMSHEMGWDSMHCISHGTYGTENDEQEIENLLNEHSDSEYECQNNNEL